MKAYIFRKRMTSQAHPIQLTFKAAKAVINSYLNQTSRAITRRDYRAIRTSFLTCERFYQEGNAMVRMLIETVYIFSLSRYMPGDMAVRKHIESMLPLHLSVIYRRQLYPHGC